MRAQNQLFKESRQVMPKWWAWFFTQPEQYRFERVILLRIHTAIREYIDESGHVRYPQPLFMNLQMIIADWVRHARGDDHKTITFLHNLQAELFVTLVKQRLSTQLPAVALSALDQTLISMHYQSVIEAHCLARITRLTESELPQIFDFPKRLRCCVMAYGGPSLAPLVEKMLSTERRERVIVPFPIQQAS
jgi:hypothetical protein